MGFLIEQFWLCLLLAFLLGVLLGWLLRHWRCRAEVEALEEELRRAQMAQPLEPAEADVETVQVKAVAAPVAELDRDSYPIEEVEGIGSGYGKALRAMGIATTLDLLDRGRTSDQRQKIASDLDREQVDERVVTSWASMCDLMRLPGIRGQFAELLEFSSINSVQELAEQKTDSLARRLGDVNEAEHRVPELPSREAVEAWIIAAANAPHRLEFSAGQLMSEEYAARGSYDIEEVEGIGRGYGKALREQGIATTHEFLEAGLQPEQRSALAERLSLRNVDADVVTSWVAMCDLLRVPGITGQYAELLYFGGVKTVRAVSGYDGNALLDKLAQTEAVQNRVPTLPRIDQVAEWVEHARALDEKLEL
jgi:predicted flap endonuclease-1-like 5' DNA nuclease